MVLKYQNPILRGMYPDPSITRVGSTYYMVNSTFEYYPGIALSKSNDLLNWTKLPGIVSSPNQADLRQSKSNEGIFAVCLRYYEHHFYVITTNFAEFKTFLIRGRLSDDGEHIEWETQRIEIDVPGIDPDIYFENQHAYVQFTGYVDKQGTKAIRQVEIELTTGKIIHEPVILTYGTGGRDVEGPHILKKSGWYYLLAAEGGTGEGHMITIFRSKSIWGPYTDDSTINPLFTNRDRASEPLQNVGHGDLFQDVNHNWWLVCLGTRPAQVGFTAITNIGRETLLYPVTWEKDWPTVNNTIPTVNVDLSQFPKHAASLPHAQQQNRFVDKFTTSDLNPEWLSLRDQVPGLSIYDGQLHLPGNEHQLSDLSTPAFVGVRQTEHDERFTVTLSPDSHVNQGSFGIATIIDADHFAALLIKQSPEGRYIVYRCQQVGDLKVNRKLGTLTEYPTALSILNRSDKKTFVATISDDKQVSFSTDSLLLSNQAIAALNTGDIQGIFAYKNAQLVISQAVREALPKHE
ncbi:Beta-xylosidase [Lactiplantibacillus pentosus KCA1]|nr:glycoside hydrolase family 43 protein [Lactiplantibacillus pentosus]EIW12448.1 Beta-xylosidase [Lactiplantibacillus pentosus KCA1]